MRRSRAATILLYCFFSLIVWSRHSVRAQEASRATEKADYTEDARHAGVQGTVILMVVFADEGVLKHILVLQGLSYGLTEQAIAAARKIRFTPAMRDGKPISVNGELEFNFSLY